MGPPGPGRRGGGGGGGRGDVPALASLGAAPRLAEGGEEEGGGGEVTWTRGVELLDTGLYVSPSILGEKEVEPGHGRVTG